MIKFVYELNKDRVNAKLFESKNRDNSWVVLFPDLSGIAIIFTEGYYALFKFFISDLENFMKYFEEKEVIYNAYN